MMPRSSHRLALALFLLMIVASRGVLAGGTSPLSPAEWQDGKKALYVALLKGKINDVLIVPFQPEENGIDLPGRALMTRYLDDRLRRTTGFRIPDPTLVARALGENARTFPDVEVYRLANDLGIRFLIRGFVGHNLKETMSVKLLVQERKAGTPLAPETPVARLEWTGLSFSDERPPEEAFLGLIDNVVAKFPITQTRKSETKRFGMVGPIALPSTIPELAEAKSVSPAENAWRLQALALLFPEDAPEREQLFERSLVALVSVAPESPDYRLLKSRALFYLARRPAAVAALGFPETADETYFSAYLDADLPTARKAMERIGSPLARVMAEIEVNDLDWAFDQNLPERARYPALTKEIPAWEMVMTCRLLERDGWTVPSNLLVKDRMDQEFPAPGAKAKELAAGMLILAESPGKGEDVLLSAHRHYRKVMELEGKQLYSGDDSASPSRRDALELLTAIGERNVVKEINLRGNIQALPEKAIEELDFVDGVYNGYPELLLLRAQSEKRISETRQQDGRSSLLAAAREHAAEAFYRSAGQTGVARRSQEFLEEQKADMTLLAGYDRDYPRRWDWNYSGPGDRLALRKEALTGRNASSLPDGSYPALKNGELGLLYTHAGFSWFTWLVENLPANPASRSAVDAFVAANGRRFAGHRGQASFRAKRDLGKGEPQAAVRIYKEAIDASPRVWQPYADFGKMLMAGGEVDNAFELYRSYPLFGDTGNDPGPNKVGLSNQACEVGQEFFWAGYPDKAIPFFKASAGYKTGSGAGMVAAARVATIEMDFPRAAAYALESFKRYNNAYSLRDYLGLLHLFGYGKQVWPLFDTVVSKGLNPPVWYSAFIGHRLDGSRDDEILTWYGRPEIRNVEGNGIGSPMMLELFVDRPVDEQLVAKIREAEVNRPATGVEDRYVAEAPGRVSDLAGIYWRVKSGNVGDVMPAARSIEFMQRQPDLIGPILPYMVWGSVKSGIGPSYAQFAERYREKSPFDYELAKAAIAAGTGNHDEAVRRLKAASFRIPREAQPIPPWYRLVEWAEWFYADSKRPEYRELALDWAKRHQRIQPMYAWAYAVEARYAEEGPARTRALAMALHLDRRSERITAIPEAEKEKAREWLKANNPFKMPSAKSGQGL
ncbi:MAG TPA: hypothetical protein VGK27_00995 [Candidatus Deferrimicrobiaceae bacterium]|jgi:hypothetical protein